MYFSLRIPALPAKGCNKSCLIRVCWCASRRSNEINNEGIKVGKARALRSFGASASDGSGQLAKEDWQPQAVAGDGWEWQQQRDLMDSFCTLPSLFSTIYFLAKDEKSFDRVNITAAMYLRYLRQLLLSRCLRIWHIIKCTQHEMYYYFLLDRSICHQEKILAEGRKCIVAHLPQTLSSGRTHESWAMAKIGCYWALLLRYTTIIQWKPWSTD